MTLAIQRQPRFNKVLLVGGLVVLAAGLSFAISRAIEPTAGGHPAVVQTQTNAAALQRFEAIQDDYLVPPAIVAREAANEAQIRLQNGYLPPVTVGAAREAWLMVQDGYLPPTDGGTPVETPRQPTTSDRFGPR